MLAQETLTVTLTALKMNVPLFGLGPGAEVERPGAAVQANGALFLGRLVQQHQLRRRRRAFAIQKDLLQPRLGAEELGLAGSVVGAAVRRERRRGVAPPRRSSARGVGIEEGNQGGRTAFGNDGADARLNVCRWW